MFGDAEITKSRVKQGTGTHMAKVMPVGEGALGEGTRKEPRGQRNDMGNILAFKLGDKSAGIISLLKNRIHAGNWYMPL